MMTTVDETRGQSTDQLIDEYIELFGTMPGTSRVDARRLLRLIIGAREAWAKVEGAKEAAALVLGGHRHAGP
jgi:hypothetical protein